MDIATGDEERALVSADQPEFTPVRPPRAAPALRNHWSIENSRHHAKDPSWEEDVRKAPYWVGKYSPPWSTPD